jgi:hypothetical protein
VVSVFGEVESDAFTCAQTGGNGSVIPTGHRRCDWLTTDGLSPSRRHRIGGESFGIMNAGIALIITSSIVLSWLRLFRPGG